MEIIKITKKTNQEINLEDREKKIFSQLAKSFQIEINSSLITGGNIRKILKELSRRKLTLSDIHQVCGFFSLLLICRKIFGNDNLLPKRLRTEFQNYCRKKGKFFEKNSLFAEKEVDSFNIWNMFGPSF